MECHMGEILENYRYQVRYSSKQWGTWSGSIVGSRCAEPVVYDILEGIHSNEVYLRDRQKNHP